MNYFVNSLLKINSEDEQILVRVLWLNDEFAYVIDINKNNVPYIILRIYMDSLVEKGDIVVEEKDPISLAIKEEDIPQKYKEIRDKSWNMIKDIVIQEPQIYQTTYRRKTIKEVSSRSNISELSVLSYLKRYWKRGRIPNSLLPDYFNCGGRGKERTSGNTKRGRPRKHKDVAGEGVNVTEDIKKIFTISINKFYYTSAKNSLVLTYELMRKEYFSNGDKIINGVKVPIIKPQSQIPTFGQFRYWFLKERSIKKEITSRYSNKKFQKQYRAIPGNADDGIMQPGTFEIDCQIGDVYLVSRFNRNWVIGRPAIYIVIDKFSRIICGVYVGLETGSYAGAMMALLNTATDKVKFCEQYGIIIEENDWPVHCLPEKIIADRGEIEGTNIDNLINTLNVQVSLTPSYRADLKSFVEKFFSINNNLIKPYLPGKIDLDGRERGDSDYRISAKLDLFQFTQIIIKSILYYNNYSILNNYSRDEMMVADDVACIPRNIFNWGIANRGGSLRSVDNEVIKLALMPSADATVTAKGVRYKDMYYTSKTMLIEQTLVNARNKTWKVKISFDPRDLTYIYVHGDSPKEYEKCFLTNPNSRYKDKIMEEVEYLLSIEKIQKEEMKGIEVQAKTQLVSEVEYIVKNAKDEYKKTENNNESDKKRIENIRENRKIEKSANRTKEVFILDKDENQNEKCNIEDDEIEPLELLLEKQRKVLQDGR